MKRWLIGIAQRTAQAAKEGGFLGFGGVQVSETETGAIRDVARALGVAPPPALAAYQGADASQAAARWRSPRPS